MLSALGLGSATSDPDAFTREVLAVFQGLPGDRKIEAVGPLELSVTLPDGAQHSVHLDNLFQTCLANPRNRAREIVRFAQVLVDGPAAEAILPRNVVPVVRDRAFVTELKQSLAGKAKPEKPKPELMFEPLGADLVVIYVCDNPQTVQYLTREDIKELHMTTSLREMALDNLRRILPDIKSQGANGLHFFSADNCYEPSLVLNDKLWAKFKEQSGVKGEILFGVPARGVLIVADSGIPEAVEYLGKAIREMFSQQPYRISDKIYVRHLDRIDFYNPEQQSLTS